MASGIINLNNSGQTSGGGYLMGKVEWSSTPNTETNKSSGVARLYVKKASATGTITAATTGNWDCSLTVNGENLSQKVYAGITADWVLLLEKTFTVEHNSDGTKSIPIAASVYGPSGTLYSGLQTAGSGTAALDTIPRASTASFSAFTLGQKGTISINRASASFKHTLTYTFGNASGTIASGVTAASVSWTPPTSLGSQIPNAKSGTGAITLDTYSGSTKIGSKTYNFTLNVPSSAAPDVAEGWAKAAYYNAGTAAASIAAFVQGYSKAQVTFDSSKITTKYGATVKSYKIVCGSVTDTASPYLTGVLTGTSATITCTVEDSRGYTASGTLTVALNPYKKPALSDLALYRSDEDGTANRAGLCIYAKATLTWSSLGGQNTCSLTGNFRLQSGSYPAAGTEMTSGVGILLTVAAAATSTYVAKIEAKDSLGNTAVYEATIPTDSVAFHIREGGQGAAFGKYSEEDDLLDVAWNSRVRKNLTVDGAASVGTVMELGGSASGHGGAVDFHYNGAADDYTSRIIETAAGFLQVYGDFSVGGKLNGLYIKAGCKIFQTTAANAIPIFTSDDLNTLFGTSGIAWGMSNSVCFFANGAWESQKIPVCAACYQNVWNMVSTTGANFGDGSWFRVSYLAIGWT